MNYEEWKQLWRIGIGRPAHGFGGDRLGQAFVNDFLIGDGPLIRKIYFLDDYWEVDALITQWLIDNCHYPNVPEKVS